jgi:hypothetical protein
MSKISKAMEKAVRYETSDGVIRTYPKSKSYIENIAPETERIYISLYNKIFKNNGSRLIQFVDLSKGENGWNIIEELLKVASFRFSQSVLLVNGNNSVKHHKYISGHQHLDWEQAFKRTGSIQDSIVQIGQSNMYISQLSTTLESFSFHGRIDSIFAELKRAFDLILINSPAPEVSPIFSLLHPHVDRTIALVECEQTRLQALRHVKNELSSTNNSTPGVILFNRKYYIPEWLYNKFF